jgi:P27 family predicted phage terminase small subunit
MGKRGPAPTPTELLRQRGSKLAKGRANEVAPEKLDPEGLPQPPDWLNIDAAVHWQKLGHELARMGLLTQLDQLSLAMLCDKLSMYCAAKACISRGGKWDVTEMVVSSESGGNYQAPEVGICNKAWDAIVTLCKQYGMTPSSRVGLSVDKKSGKVVDAKSKFFNGNRP